MEISCIWLCIITSDKYCQQSGQITTPSNNQSGATITFRKAFKDTNYTLQLTQLHTGAAWSTCPPLMFYNKTKTGVATQSQHTTMITWYAAGYIS